MHDSKRNKLVIKLQCNVNKHKQSVTRNEPPVDAQLVSLYVVSHLDIFPNISSSFGVSGISNNTVGGGGCFSHLAVGVAGATLPPTGQHRGVLRGSTALAALLLHRLLIQWLRGAGWVCQGVCVGVWGYSVTRLCAGLGSPLPGLGVSLLGAPVVLHSLFQRLVGDEHSLTHLGGTPVRHWCQVWVGRGGRELGLRFGGGTGVGVMGGAVGTQGRPS